MTDTTDSIGVFGHGVWHVTDQFALTAGLRFENLALPLTRYRVHAGSMTSMQAARMHAEADAVREQVARHFFPGWRERDYRLLAAAAGLKTRPSEWREATILLSRAALLAPQVAAIDAAFMRHWLAEAQIGLLTRTRATGAATADAVEMLAEESDEFACWRAAAGGALDTRLMALMV